MVYAVAETLHKNDNESNVSAFEIIKCRTNHLFYSQYDWPLFTVLDEPKPYI